MNSPEVEAAYPLSPMQRGMLFHALYGLGTDLYFGQAHWPLRGELDVSVYRAAWQRAVDRHAALRTSFNWRRAGEPLQVVHRSVAFPFEQQDWRGLSRQQQDERLRAFLSGDRQRGLDLETAPLLRITAIRLDESEWRVIWSGHHITADGRSMVLVLREVMALYEAEKTGRPAELPTPTPYSDFIAWLETQDREAVEAYWKERIRGFAAPTSFRARHPHGSEDVIGASAQAEVSLPETTERRLHALARSSGVTVNTVIAAAWALLLSRHCGREDVVFGLTVGSGGRGAPLSRSLVGLLINTLPLRVQVDPNATVHSFLQFLRSRMQEMRQYASTPLPKIQRWSDLPPGMPLFDSIVVFDNASIDRLVAGYGSLEVGHLTVEQRSSYPLNLVVRRGPRLTLSVLYYPHRFSHDAMKRLVAELEHVLEAMLAAPEGALGTLPILPPDERQRLLVGWNTTRRAYPRDQPFYRLVEAQAARRPDAVAVGSESERLTYRELNRRANGLAHRLCQEGVGPETVVGIALERSPDLVVGMLGVAKAGGAFLLLDPNNPPERIAFMLSDAGASLLVTHRRLLQRLGDQGQSICLDDPALLDLTDHNLEVDVSRRNLAYVIYTSGTTGRPKGVMIEHSSLLNLVAWHQEAFAVSPDDRATQLAGPGFDAVIWEVWPYLTAGASLHISCDAVRAVPQRLQQWLLDYQITISFLPTPLAEAVLSLSWPLATPLRTMLVGGDVLHSTPAPSLPFHVVNNYGPTEYTVVATSGRVCAAECPPTIGRPIANTEVYLLDRQRQPVPLGAVGEIYLAGAGLARGYLNRPELTEARFLPHPFRPGERVYRTGDLACYREDGAIEFVGRADRQIKIRGVRIEPGEIEAAIRLHPDIRDAAVAVREQAPVEQRLIAYVAPGSSPWPDASELRRFLRSRLPEHMIPTVWVPVDALPLTLNGKVDRAGLMVTGGAEVELPADNPAPRTDLEMALAAIWQKTLKLERVGVRDDFFDVGGDSLLAVALVEQIRTRLSRVVAISDLFAAPTIETLALMLEGRTPASNSVLVPIQPHGSRPPFFCAAPILGTVFPYYELAQQLADDQPLYGLQPLGLSAPHTVEALARRYVEAMRSVQSGGPYHLGGWSFGGLVAFEMAQQLMSSGQAVSLLAIVDTPAPGSYHHLRSSAAARFFITTIMRGLWLYLRDYEYLAAEARTTSVRHEMNGKTVQGSEPRWLELIRHRLGRAAISAIVPPESHLLLYYPPTIRQMLRAFGQGLAATLRYRPRVFPGAITLLRTSEPEMRGECSALLGWDDVVAGEITAYTIPGNHMTLFRRPHVIELARSLQEALDQSFNDNTVPRPNEAGAPHSRGTVSRR